MTQVVEKNMYSHFQSCDLNKNAEHKMITLHTMHFGNVSRERVLKYSAPCNTFSLKTNIKLVLLLSKYMLTGFTILR